MAHSPPKKNRSLQPTHTIRDTRSTRALLAHAWLFLGKWLDRLLLLLLAAGLGGWAIGSFCYTRKFSGLVSVEEQIAPDEAHATQMTIQDTIRVAKQYRDNTRVLRDVHAKIHGCVKAKFKVRADLDPALHRGVFAGAGKSWNAWVRFSNDNAYPWFDSRSDTHGMAIKLLDMPDKKLLPGRGRDSERDFVTFNRPVFFIRDIAEYRQNFAAQVDGKKALTFFPNRDPTSWELRHLLIALRTLTPAPDSPLHAGYNGIPPCGLGERSIKFRVVPAPEKCSVYQLPKQNQDPSSFLRTALYQQLSVDRIPACYALQVQHQDPGRYTPIEDTSVEWKESNAPFTTIADIIVLTQDSDSREQNLFCDNPLFNPWRMLLEYRPISGINRSREAVYGAVNGYRLGRNG